MNLISHKRSGWRKHLAFVILTQKILWQKQTAISSLFQNSINNDLMTYRRRVRPSTAKHKIFASKKVSSHIFKIIRRRVIDAISPQKIAKTFLSTRVLLIELLLSFTMPLIVSCQNLLMRKCNEKNDQWSFFLCENVVF